VKTKVFGVFCYCGDGDSVPCGDSDGGNRSGGADSIAMVVVFTVGSPFLSRSSTSTLNTYFWIG